MERVPGRTIPANLPAPSLRWRVIGQYLPLAILALAAFFIFRDLRGGGDPTPASPMVEANHSQLLAANIAFFEGRVGETKDNLSYNRLTGLYLQRLRETGDVADVQRAELSATKSLENAPNDYAGLTNLALVKIAEHDFETAGQLAHQAISIVPARPTAFAILGDVEMALGQYDSATTDYNKYLAAEPGFAAYSREAALADAHGNIPVEIQFWQAAIDADKDVAPENTAWARVQLGTLYFNLGRLDDAKDQFSKSLAVYPNYSYAQAGLGQVAAAKGDYNTAIDFYTKATNTIPQPIFVMALGDVYERAGQHDKAQREFALMGAIDQLFTANNIKNDFTMIAFALDHGGDIPATLERAKTAYEQRPAVQAADLYAWALYRSGQFEAARAMAERALSSGTPDPNFYYHAGMIAYAQGDTAAARTYLQHADDLNPNFNVQHAPELAATLKALGGTP